MDAWRDRKTNMLTDAWSIGLLSCSVVTLFLSLIGVKTGWRIIRSWDIGSGSELQIRLEEEVYLSAVLVEFGFAIQLLSVLMVVLAADYFSNILVGAMCATGALTANSYGVPVLLVKLLSLFLSAAWIVCHKLDISSEYYPLVKTKYYLLFFILPLLILDSTLLVLYLYDLNPDIITSCCGVLFSSQINDGYNLFTLMPSSGLLFLYGIVALVLSGIAFKMSRHGDTTGAVSSSTAWAVMGLWLVFYFFSLLVVTVYTSPYIYAMPHHRCPFDLLKTPYMAVGYPLYFFLHGAVVAGISTSIGRLSEGRRGLATPAARLRFWAGRLSLVFMAVFLLMVIYHPLIYQLRGGEG